MHYLNVVCRGESSYISFPHRKPVERSEKEMNKGFKLGMIALIMTLFAVMVMPVSAAESMTKIDSTIAPSFAFSMVAGDQTFPLAVGENLKDINSITVTSNTGYTIAVSDKLDQIAKPANTRGKMALLTTGGAWEGSMLFSPLEVGINGGAYSPLPTIVGEVTIRDISAGETFTAPLKLKQVVSVTDKITTTANPKYNMYLKVVASAKV